MQQERHEDHGCQQIGQMLFSMPEVMFEMIALCFQGVVVFIFDFPARAGRSDDFGNIGYGNCMGSGPRITVDRFALLIGCDEFAPVDGQGIVTVYQRQMTDKAMLKRINQLIRDIQREPFAGIGKPEPLKHQLAGFWSRRIDNCHRLVYAVEGDTLLIAQCRDHY